jgi:outer membrane biosynthesis protein TonB
MQRQIDLPRASVDVAAIVNAPSRRRPLRDALSIVAGVVGLAIMGTASAQTTMPSADEPSPSTGLPAGAKDASAASINSDLTPHKAGQPQFLLFTAPDYPPASMERSQSGAVDLVGHVALDGNFKSFELVSPPSDFDEAVRRVVKSWVVVPPTCAPWGADVYELHVRVIFTAEDKHYYITLHDAKYVYIGEPSDRVLAPVVAASQTMPRYPLLAYWHGAHSGLALARISINADGSVSKVDVPFTYPRDFFVKSTVEALGDWRFQPAPDGKEWSVCVVVNYRIER